MKRQTWIDWFLSQPENQLFVRIDDDYLRNIYNFYGIKQKISNFQASYELILKNYVPPWHANTQLESQVFVLEQQTAHLYGLLHARYLLTLEGMEKIYQKYIRNEFPHCPRVLCRKIGCLPFGVSNNMSEYPVKMFCPNCNDVYNVKDPIFSKVDGSFFGNSWIPLFLKKYRHIIPSNKARAHVPKIFGFDVLLGSDSDSDSNSKENDKSDISNDNQDNDMAAVTIKDINENTDES
ncbi:hypothetical protein M9Y10_001153 [Tritrichomonas musculus]|uniref:Casein kinase II subunit beta n=1 Tax=Tritrichomonas musculus TaxID=1915356 RepID=A0ABR2L790_9EUKA